MKRIEFSAKVRLAAWERSGGLCECGCQVKILPGDGPEYDHRVEAVLGGEATLQNCVVLRRRCHQAKTSARAPVLAKTRRLEKAASGIRPRKVVIPGSKASKWRKKIDGSVERR